VNEQIPLKVMPVPPSLFTEEALPMRQWLIVIAESGAAEFPFQRIPFRALLKQLFSMNRAEADRSEARPIDEPLPENNADNVPPSLRPEKMHPLTVSFVQLPSAFELPSQSAIVLAPVPVLIKLTFLLPLFPEPSRITHAAAVSFKIDEADAPDICALTPAAGFIVSVFMQVAPEFLLMTSGKVSFVE
jgi:hypothetical protein